MAAISNHTHHVSAVSPWGIWCLTYWSHWRGWVSIALFVSAIFSIRSTLSCVGLVVMEITDLRDVWTQIYISLHWHWNNRTMSTGNDATLTHWPLGGAAVFLKYILSSSCRIPAETPFLAVMFIVVDIFEFIYIYVDRFLNTKMVCTRV